MRDRDHGPADRVRSRLRLHGVGIQIEPAKEHIRVLEIEAPEDLRGLESRVLRALPERVTFLRWSHQGRHVNMLLAFSGPLLPASSPRPSAFGDGACSL